MKDREMWARVISLSLLPAVWALVAGLTGIIVAAVGMLAATVCVMGAKQTRDYWTMTAGFAIGLGAGYVTNWLFAVIPISPLISVPILLIIVVALLIILQKFIAKFVNLFGILCSFSTILVVLGITEPPLWTGMLIQTGIAELVGIWFFAFVGGIIQRLFLNRGKK